MTETWTNAVSVLKPGLSDFCRRLTTITQEQVDAAVIFAKLVPLTIPELNEAT
jgi:inhibitor of KinA sporulation pathway (predicted exonuclease)